jgi:hypothetical protein
MTVADSEIKAVIRVSLVSTLNDIDDVISDAYEFASDLDDVVGETIVSVERSPKGFDVTMDIYVDLEAWQFDNAVRPAKRYCIEELGDMDAEIRKLTRNP